jgi:hypothetical protein
MTDVRESDRLHRAPWPQRIWIALGVCWLISCVYQVLTPYHDPGTTIVVPPLHLFVIGGGVSNMGRGSSVFDVGNPMIAFPLGRSVETDPHVTDTAYENWTFLALLPGTTTIVPAPGFYSPSRTDPANGVKYTVIVP